MKKNDPSTGTQAWLKRQIKEKTGYEPSDEAISKLFRGEGKASRFLDAMNEILGWPPDDDANAAAGEFALNYRELEQWQRSFLLKILRLVPQLDEKKADAILQLMSRDGRGS